MKKHIQSMLQDIRDYSEKMIAESDLVRINKHEIKKLADIINVRKETVISQTDIQLSPKNEIGLNVLYGSVHYCFTHPYTQKEFIYTKEGKTYHRSTGFITALRSAEIDWSNFTEVSSLSPKSWYEILGTSDEKNLYQLKKRHQNITRFAKYLLSSGIVGTTDIINKLHSAEEVMQILIDSKLFNDFFLKRAQVTTFLLSSILRRNNYPNFNDLHILTAMPDYRLPQLLYNLHVIDIPTELTRSLRNKQRFEKNSEIEILLRATVIVVVRQLAKTLNIIEAEVDSKLWSYSQDLINQQKMPIPAMLVATDSY